MPELKLDQLAVAHLEPVSLSVAESELICISGESGSGKSLLLRAIADIIPHQGDVLLGDVAASSMTAPEWRRKVSLLPAESQWWSDDVADHFEQLLIRIMLVVISRLIDEIAGFEDENEVEF